MNARLSPAQLRQLRRIVAHGIGDHPTASRLFKAGLVERVSQTAVRATAAGVAMVRNDPAALWGGRGMGIAGSERE